MSDQPAEHCGHQPATLATHPTECVLRPGHSGSHADETGMRWWETAPAPAPAPADADAALAVRDTELEQLRAEVAVVKAIGGGYCPACGRGDCSPTADQWYEQKQRADRAEAVVARVKELAGSWLLGHHEGDLGPGWESAAAALLAVMNNPHVTHYEIGLDHAATTGRDPQEQP